MGIIRIRVEDWIFEHLCPNAYKRMNLWYDTVQQLKGEIKELRKPNNLGLQIGTTVSTASTTTNAYTNLPFLKVPKPNRHSWMWMLDGNRRCLKCGKVVMIAEHIKVRECPGKEVV